MKVLFQSYNTCCQNKAGGVQIRIRRIKKILNESKIDVDFFDTFSTKLVDYDILHVFGLSHENYALIKYAKKNGLKVVISSIVSIKDKFKIGVYTKFINRLPLLTVYKMMHESLQLADLVIAETLAEKKFIEKYYGINSERIIVIPNGVDEIDQGNDSIFDVLGTKKAYILQVGRFDENKNQLNVIRALKDSSLDVIFIGGPASNSEEYFKKCQKEAENSKNIHFLGWLDSESEKLKSAYWHADTVVLPSYQETFGLVLLEGGMAGAKLAMSKTLPILDYEVFDRSLTFDPSNINDIRNVLEKAVLKSKDFSQRETLRRVFSWNSIVKEHINCYQNVLK